MPEAAMQTKVEPKLKEQAEQVLSNLGIPIDNAINLFLRQIVLQNGLPFNVDSSQNAPLIFSTLSDEEFNKEIEKGLTSYHEGRVLASAEIRKKMQRQYKNE